MYHKFQSDVHRLARRFRYRYRFDTEADPLGRVFASDRCYLGLARDFPSLSRQ